MNSLLYHCFPSLFMTPHFSFIGRKCHQSFRQLINRSDRIFCPKRTEETGHVEYKELYFDPLGEAPFWVCSA